MLYLTKITTAPILSLDLKDIYIAVINNKYYAVTILNIDKLVATCKIENYHKYGQTVLVKSKDLFVLVFRFEQVNKGFEVLNETQLDYRLCVDFNLINSYCNTTLSCNTLYFNNEEIREVIDSYNKNKNTVSYYYFTNIINHFVGFPTPQEVIPKQLTLFNNV